jgi:hypothetical protein
MGPLALVPSRVTTTAIAPQKQPIAQLAAAPPPRASAGDLAKRLNSVTLGGAAETGAQRQAQQAAALEQQRREAQRKRQLDASGPGHVEAKVAKHTADLLETEMLPPSSAPAGCDDLGDRFFS